MGSQTPITTTTPLRLAILEADTPLPSTRAKYSSYGGVFTSLFTRAASPTPLSSLLTITYHDIVGPSATYPSLDDIDAILITGSKHNAFEDGEGGWISALTEFVRRALESERGIKVVGVCFGHQIVARALGVPVGRNAHGWEVSVTDVRLTEEGRRLFGKDSLKIHQMHRDAVASLPAGAVALAETDVCPVQGFVIPGKAITVQGHPEFTGPIVQEILDSRRDMGILSDEIYKSGTDRVEDEHDGVAIARAFLKFLRE
ncbi:class I glutamine amidotransferase-like protein [Coniochaeta ligniaria NRRL 30616]|uniref:Class I glutamine amidotransferase-like protein n=1 Tax=Coniochaeta ligniaria NRRL 30616 TaxID=1408157 RepID=A0A1J7J5P7_9PEZI|nr:class I glutamine amidotransferase-like protein [Coniochaeta ligniaria NRRL 30616]